MHTTGLYWTTFLCAILCVVKMIQVLAPRVYNSLMLVYDHFMCTALEDLANDGDHKLLVGDLGSGQYDMKLKVFKGKCISAHTHALTYSSLHPHNVIH